VPLSADIKKHRLAAYGVTWPFGFDRAFFFDTTNGIARFAAEKECVADKGIVQRSRVVEWNIWQHSEDRYSLYTLFGFLYFLHELSNLFENLWGKHTSQLVLFYKFGSTHHRTSIL
jgi:hypothetical protein